MTRTLTWPALALAALLAIGGCGMADAAPQQPDIIDRGLGILQSGGDEQTTTATVVRVVDGDTVKLDDGRTVRVLGIDTPETKRPGVRVQCYGPEATAFAQATLEGQRVRVAEDSGQDKTDRYGRTLAYLLLSDGTNYSVVAAGAGVATTYVFDGRPVREHPAILAAQLHAQARGLGMWGACPR